VSDAPDRPEEVLEMENIIDVLIPGTGVSGLDVSSAHAGWSKQRPAVDAFPSVDGTGVSAGGCRT
jgi:hypothetical protein